MGNGCAPQTTIQNDFKEENEFTTNHNQSTPPKLGRQRSISEVQPSVDTSSTTNDNKSTSSCLPHVFLLQTNIHRLAADVVMVAVSADLRRPPSLSLSIKAQAKKLSNRRWRNGDKRAIRIPKKKEKEEAMNAPTMILTAGLVPLSLKEHDMAEYITISVRAFYAEAINVLSPEFKSR